MKESKAVEWSKLLWGSLIYSADIKSLQRDNKNLTKETEF